MSSPHSSPMIELPEDLPATFGRYRVHRRIGRGGMGVVYEATHIHLERKVALKLLRRSLAEDKHFLERFYREIKALGKVLNNTHVILATDGGEEAGIPFLTMEFVDGMNLDELLKAHGGKLPVGAACELMRQTALGLDAIHQHGLVHRDLKPTNLMLTPDGVVKILDLGLVRLCEDPTDHSEITPAYGVIGTLDYQAPEQAIDARHVDIRADIYSLGCTLYKLLAGEAPFAKHERFLKIDAHAALPIPPLPEETPEEVHGVVMKMLAKKAADRYQTPLEVATALTPFAAPIVSASPSTPSTVVPGSAATAPMTPAPTDASTAGSTMTAYREPTPTSSTTLSDPQPVKPARGRYVVVGLIVAALLIGPLGFFGFRQWNVRPDPTALDRLPLHQTVFLLEHAPTPILWKPLEPQASFRHEPDTKRFQVVCAARDVALFSLGSANAASYELQMRIFQSAWSPGVGVVIGYHTVDRREGDDTVIAEFQMINLNQTIKDPNSLERQLVIERSLGKHLRKPNGQEHVRYIRKYSAPLPPINNERLLTIAVADGRLVNVQVEQCGPMSELFSKAANAEFGPEFHRGQIGMWISGTTVGFHEAGFRLNKK